MNDLPYHMLRDIGIWPFRDPDHHRIWREGTVKEAAWLKDDGCLIHPAFTIREILGGVARQSSPKGNQKEPSSWFPCSLKRWIPCCSRMLRTCCGITAAQQR
ncbi:MAG: hypothetical protein AAAC48_20000, partial [Phyllobacterium sp.]|uniref:hypothetical protein n=1 Tax=Phyllobacterium sp. TaxID=1871046 RepID=UPI0030F1C15F